MAATVELIDHMADVGLLVRADDAQEAFAAVAAAMFGIMLDIEFVAEAESWQIAIEASDWEDLLIRWLEELLYEYELKRRVPSRIRIKRISSNYLEAHLLGDRFDASRHQGKVQIKAVTYHQLKAEKSTRGFAVRVIFDI